MKLTSTDGAFVELAVVGYQFGGAGDRFDANWLVISGRAHDGERGWDFTDPCLLTVEARSLANWLLHITNPEAEVERLDFTEPNLWFDRVRIDGDVIALRVGFELEARPAWAVDGGPGDDGFFLDIVVSCDLCRAAGKTWLEELGPFPAR